MNTAELIIVRDRAAAMAGGFNEHGRHHADPDIRAWWPARGFAELYCARPCQRVLIIGWVPDKTPEGSLRAIIRKRQMVYGASAVLMEFA